MFGGYIKSLGHRSDISTIQQSLYNIPDGHLSFVLQGDRLWSFQRSTPGSCGVSGSHSTGCVGISMETGRDRRSELSSSSTTNPSVLLKPSSETSSSNMTPCLHMNMLPQTASGSDPKRGKKEHTEENSTFHLSPHSSLAFPWASDHPSL
ncbi:hypothetical protein ATANTOWER_025207 [Ataeniobius toweri]|uniref:Uncharacterized protein n=1 Tax=Ataeniobius toweri TaxID=208326 RepID=A0ABU7CCP6_9TELE|nr:hypothetical protein [Ataeniobius toweri]